MNRKEEVEELAKLYNAILGTNKTIQDILGSPWDQPIEEKKVPTNIGDWINYYAL